MNFERIVATNERGLVEQSCDFIEQHVRAFHARAPTGACFVMGLAGPNGRVRRERALDTYTELASRGGIDWGRVRIFLVDERYGFDAEEESNAYLVRKARRGHALAFRRVPRLPQPADALARLHITCVCLITPPPLVAWHAGVWQARAVRRAAGAGHVAADGRAGAYTPTPCRCLYPLLVPDTSLPTVEQALIPPL